MHWQEIIALAVVAITAAAFLARWYRRKKLHSFQRATGCGCTPADNASKASIVIEGKRGEKPRITVRAK